MMKNLAAIGCVGFLLSVVAAGGCSTKSSTASDAPAGVLTISGAGSTFVAPLFRKWFDQYHEEHPNVVVDYRDVGSGEGTTRFLDESVDFGASDAALTDEQIAGFKDGAVLVPVTAGMIVLAYNLEDMPRNLKLSRDVYADIFLQKVKRWDDPRIVAINPGAKLPPREIAVTVRQDGSGTTFAFTNHLAAVSEEWRKGPGVGKIVGWPNGAVMAQGNGGVTGIIVRSPGTLGFVEYGFAKKLGLGMASLENKSGNYIEPTAASGLAALIEAKMPKNLRVFIPDPEGADSYPIVTYSWLLVRRYYNDSKTADSLKELIRWCLNDGQENSESLGYLRLPPHVVSLAIANIASNGQ
jgi:phosphate transport system substrate-binding protein